MFKDMLHQFVFIVLSLFISANGSSFLSVQVNNSFSHTLWNVSLFRIVSFSKQMSNLRMKQSNYTFRFVFLHRSTYSAPIWMACAILLGQYPDNFPFCFLDCMYLGRRWSHSGETPFWTQGGDVWLLGPGSAKQSPGGAGNRCLPLCVSQPAYCYGFSCAT